MSQPFGFHCTNPKSGNHYDLVIDGWTATFVVMRKPSDTKEHIDTLLEECRELGSDMLRDGMAKEVQLSVKWDLRT